MLREVVISWSPFRDDRFQPHHTVKRSLFFEKCSPETHMNVKHMRCIHELCSDLILAHKINRTQVARSVDFHRRRKVFRTVVTKGLHTNCLWMLILNICYLKRIFKGITRFCRFSLRSKGHIILRECQSV